jgi:small subunit ribosomal protein S16
MLKIRLRRMGSKHRPFYRVVVSDSRNTPKGAFVETLGHYDPSRKPPSFTLDVDRVEHWVGLGAQASERVRKLVNAEVRRREKGEEAPPAAVDAIVADAPAESADEPEASTEEAASAPAPEGGEESGEGEKSGD